MTPPEELYATLNHKANGTMNVIHIIINAVTPDDFFLVETSDILYITQRFCRKGVTVYYLFNK